MILVCSSPAGVSTFGDVGVGVRPRWRRPCPSPRTRACRGWLAAAGNIAAASVTGAPATTPSRSSSGAYAGASSPANSAACPPWEWPHTNVFVVRVGARAAVARRARCRARRAPRSRRRGTDAVPGCRAPRSRWRRRRSPATTSLPIEGRRDTMSAVRDGAQLSAMPWVPCAQLITGRPPARRGIGGRDDHAGHRDVGTVDRA